MITNDEYKQTRSRVQDQLAKSGIVLTPHEATTIEIADFGLSDLERTGLQLVTYINTDRYCAKELVLFPRQTCPEHWHPPINGEPGKQETFRCRQGIVYLYVAGEPTETLIAVVPEGDALYYTARHEIVLNPGEQYTIEPNIPHWFQGGPDGAIVSEFSSRSRDEFDQFRDPRITRVTEIHG